VGCDNPPELWSTREGIAFRELLDILFIGDQAAREQLQAPYAHEMELAGKHPLMQQEQIRENALFPQ
jgi:hypothetical protein